MGILETLTAMFAPDDCLQCGREGSLLCADCFAYVPSLPNRCLVCSARAPEAAICKTCLPEQPYSSLGVAAHYSGIARLLVACLKFRGNQSAARIMGLVMSRKVGALADQVLITHMPATTAHVRQRGFDQAALIAKRLALLSGRSYASVIRRSGSWHQLGADRQTRLIQLSAALRVTQNVAGRHVLLVDDVVTTGSSLKAATEVLLAAGAERVDCLVFAQAFTAKK